MTEWLLLLVLVPAIVIPIVLLFGFAGCDIPFPLKDPPVFPGTVTAQVDSRSAITLLWEYTGLGAARFEVRRKRSLDATFEVVTPDDLTDTEFTVTGLEEDTSYDFLVAAIQLSDNERSAPAAVTAVTLGKAFESTLPDEDDGRTRCIIQRIEPPRLSRSGSRVQLTLQRPSGGALLINRVAISHAAATGDRYDSDGPPTLIVDIAAPLFIPADPAAGILELPAIDFALDQTRPLLVAFDLGAVGQLRLLLNVNPSDATGFVSPPNTQEAALADRQPGYVELENIFLVQRIDVG